MRAAVFEHHAEGHRVRSSQVDREAGVVGSASRDDTGGRVVSIGDQQSATPAYPGCGTIGYQAGGTIDRITGQAIARKAVREERGRIRGRGETNDGGRQSEYLDGAFCFHGKFC